jgi:hypothetical protein
MASEEEHCRDCVIALGKSYWEVHQWLDEFFPTMGVHHRLRRHHTEGVKAVRKKWGDEAARAAEIHILKDCFGKIPTLEEATLWDILTV